MSNATGDDEHSAKKGSSDGFGSAVSRIAVAQICESTGFQGSQRFALDALTDVAIRYISSLGKAAHLYANSSGRIDCNVFDVIQGLEDLGAAQGFAGAADAHHCLAGSGVIRELNQYMITSEEVPFARPVLRFPVARERKPAPSFAQLGLTPSGEHIPDWLPVFPEPHTYINTQVFSEAEGNIRANNIEQARQQRKVERYLLRLQQRFAWDSAAGPVPTDDGDAGRGRRLAEVNPFLASPLPYEEEKVPETAMTSDNAAAVKKMSVLETFAPVIKADDIGPVDHWSCEKRVLPSKRPTVHFKLGGDKKSMMVALSSNTLGFRTDSLFLRDDEKDDKKRRAEMILKEAMENTEELTQT